MEIIPSSIRLERMSDEEYFALPGGSNSKLSLINPDEGGSSVKYLEGFKGSFSDSFEVGSAVHIHMLQPDDIIISPISKPGGKLGLFIEKIVYNRDKRMSIEDSIYGASLSADYYSGKLSTKILKTAITKGLKYYFDKKANPDHLFLSASNQIKYVECCKALDKFKPLLNPMGFLETPESCCEYAIFADIKVTIDGREIIVPFKGKIDNYVVDWENNTLTLNDLKTTGRPLSYFMGEYVNMIGADGIERRQWIDGSFQKFHYYRQFAVYFLLLILYYKSKGYVFDTRKANVLVVETVPNHNSAVFQVKNSDIQRGLEEFKRLIIEVAKLQLNGIQ